MIWPWGVLAYTVVAIVLLRPLSGALAYWYYDHTTYGRGGSPSPWQWFGGVGTATMLTVAWPVLALWWLSGRALPKLGGEREAELRKREERLREETRQLRQAERDAGLEPWEHGS